MIYELKSLEHPAFERVVELYESEFPRETREPVARLEEEVRGEYRLPFRFLVEECEGGLGFIRFVSLPEIRAQFVLHIAVSKSVRGSGIGSRLLRAVREMVPEWPVLAEVESGHAMEWWVGQGAVLLTPTYTQPALHADTEPVPLNLMAVGEAARLDELVVGFYDQVWQLGRDHPFVERALSGVVR